MKAAFGTLTTILCLLIMPFPVFAESAETLVATGNAHYTAGEYDKALEAYAKALAVQPDSSEILFDKGNAHFRKGEYDKAHEAYQAAALHSKNVSLEAFAHFNMGNTLFMEGQKQVEADPQRSLSQWGEGIHHYQEALRIAPEFNEAAQNIEVVRLTMKDLADKMKTAEEAARERQGQLEEAQKALDEIIREQESEIKRNEALQREKMNSPGELQDEKTKQLASDQERTREKTGEAANMMKALEQEQLQEQPGQQQPDSCSGSMQQHFGKAREAQRSAVEKLGRRELTEALKDQEEAARNLREALDDSKKAEGSYSKHPAVKKTDGNDREKTGDKGQEEVSPQDRSGGEKESNVKDVERSRSQEQKSPGGQKEERGKGSGLSEDGAFSESPESIFREEKEHRLQLNRDTQGRYKPVEKDW